jgi:hypothetical protein
LEGYIHAKQNDDYFTPESQRRQVVTNLFNQQWVNRAWIVQEFLLSRKLRVLYGELVIPYPLLDRMGHVVSEIESTALGWRYALYNTTLSYGGWQWTHNYKATEKVS